MPTSHELHDALYSLTHLSGKDSLAQFKRLREETDPHTFEEALNNHIIENRSEDSSIILKGNFLAQVFLLCDETELFDYVQCVIDAGAQVDDDTYAVATSGGQTEGMSLIHLCAKRGDVEMLNYLVTHYNLSLTTITNLGKTLLDFLPSDFSLWQKVITLLHERNALHNICLNHSNNPSNIFNQLLQTESTAAIAILLYRSAPEAYKQCLIEQQSLATLANLALMHPEFYSCFHDAKTRQAYTKDSISFAAKNHTNELDAFENRSTLLDIKQALEPEAPLAMVNAIDDYVNRILRNPDNLRILLAILDEKLKRALHEEAIQYRLDNASTEYSVRYIGAYPYPIPNENYQTIAKRSTLERVLITLLQSAEMGKESRKWFGFIPHTRANKMIADGDFFIESQFGIGVLHGKFSHMIQWALLILGIEQGYIRTQPEITAKSIIEFLVNHEDVESHLNLFVFMTDTQCLGEISFQDPYRVCSLITTGYFGAHCRTLEAYLRDAFCSGYLQWLKAFNKAATTPITAEAFSELLCHSHTNIFLPSDFIVQGVEERIRATMSTKNTYKLSLFSSYTEANNPYVLIEKNYFSPKTHK